jgi:peptide deformylase
MQVALYGNPCLTADNITIRAADDVEKIVYEMYDNTLCWLGGVGLAGPQVGINKRIFIVDPSGGEDREQMTAYINPYITMYSQETDTVEEGCLSFPGVWLPVKRSIKIGISYTDIEGHILSETINSRMLARIIQHEFDHLSGTLIIDRVSATARKRAKKAVMSLKYLYREKWVKPPHQYAAPDAAPFYSGFARI